MTRATGRHSAGPPGPWSRRRLVVAVAGLVLAAIIAGLLTWHAAAQRPAALRPAGGSATGAAVGAAQPNTASTTPIASTSPRPSTPPSARSSSAPRPAPAPRDPLGSTAAAYLSTRTGTVLAEVYDVRTGRTWHLGPGRPQAAASVIKLDILETLLARQGSGGLPGSDRTLAQQMMEDSDNDAATSLWYRAGGPARIGVFNTAAGLGQTALSPCVVCQGFPWPGWGLSTTTPADQIALLRKLIAPSSLLAPAARAYALSLMENVTPAQRWGVSGGVPAQVTVALKNGWLPLGGADGDWQINSVGWVSGGGRDYLIAMLSTANPSEQYGIDTISQLAAMVWRAMN